MRITEETTGGCVFPLSLFILKSTEFHSLLIISYGPTLETLACGHLFLCEEKLEEGRAAGLLVPQFRLALTIATNTKRLGGEVTSMCMSYGSSLRSPPPSERTAPSVGLHLVGGLE